MLELTLQKQKQNEGERLAIFGLQKQKELLELKEYMLLGLFSFGGAILRVPMQIVPSAEPITFFSFLAGWLFGSKKGFFVGASALFISNFLVMGGQGFWTIFQLLGFGCAGILGGLLRKQATVMEVVLYTIVATLIFEAIVNLGSLPFMGFNIMAAFIFSLPFMIVHLVSNVSFSLLLPKAKKMIGEEGGFDEKELCKELLARLKRKAEEKNE